MTDRYSPDELKLEKSYIIDLCKKIVKRWKSNGTSLLFIAGMETFILGLTITPEKTFSYVWKAILKLINMLEYENAINQGKSQGERWGQVLGSLNKKIDMGEFDVNAK
ncbi:MAG: hypothetical protein KGI08_04945 [Thaumarchaeota archaeon]|nr:hypothetical protein [Nitrososphaerota archaeon]MDE1867042.1 hypothetical protein [Nitrososphaerota archaeon]